MIYLDHNATSTLLPEVLEAMRPWFGVPANPASVHRAGQAAAAAVEAAREQVAALVGGNPAGVVFTSGATEANHTFVRGWLREHPGAVAVGAVEHPCVFAAIEVAPGRKGPATVLAAGADGRVAVGPLPAGCTLVSLMMANHETGVLQPVAELARHAAEAGAGMHVDATQAAGRVALELGEVDGVVLSSHKLGGPGGTGALVLRDGGSFPALLGGGAQERGRRAGTVNTAGVVGFGAACALAAHERSARVVRWERGRERLEAGLIELGARIVGSEVARVANTTCAVFDGTRGEALVQALDLRGVCVSSGAACASGSLEPSAVLTAMGDPHPEGALRISQGPRTGLGEIEALLTALRPVLDGLALGDDW